MLVAVHYRVIAHLWGLESTQEATVVFGYRLKHFIRFFRAVHLALQLIKSLCNSALAWTDALIDIICGSGYFQKRKTTKKT